MLRKAHLALCCIIAGLAIGILAAGLSGSKEAYGTTALSTVIRTNSSQTVGYYGIGQVSCDSNETLTGGGYYSEHWHELLSVYRNGPSDDGRTWVVAMMYVAPNYFGTAPSFTVYAVCESTVQCLEGGRCFKHPVP